MTLQAKESSLPVNSKTEKPKCTDFSLNHVYTALHIPVPFDNLAGTMVLVARSLGTRSLSS